MMDTQKTSFMNMTLWLLIVQLFACNQPNNPPAETGITLVEGFTFSYQLRQPDQKILLPHHLEEISGLGLSGDEKTFVAIQDEAGKLFFIDRNNGEVIRKVKFWKDGDYEGVEWVGDVIYVVKSTGTVYEVKNFEQEEPEVEKYNYFLDADNDVEGLAFDQSSNSLLLACKAKSGGEGSNKYKKGVYSFDLMTMKLMETPTYYISLDSINEYLSKSPNIRKLEKLLKFFDPNEPFGFSPSSLAIHPQTNDLYITSSVGKLLLVLSKTGQIKHIEKLDKDVHPQPEGICFASDGTLYISNEGKGGKGRILRFSPY